MVPDVQILDHGVCGHVVSDLNTGSGRLPYHLYDPFPLLCPLISGNSTSVSYEPRHKKTC